MNRTAILNAIAHKIDAQRYLEIGVCDPKRNFNKIEVGEKVGVDPAVSGPGILRMTSDDFFQMNSRVFDLVFIDGLHVDEQVWKDFLNAWKATRENGVIVFHDCLPNNEREAGPKPLPNTDGWCGTVWNAFLRVRRLGVGLSLCVNTDWGCGVVFKNSDVMARDDIPVNPSFSLFKSNVKSWLNLMREDEFKKVLDVWGKTGK